MKEGKMIKRIKREPLISESMSKEEKDDRFEREIRRLMKQDTRLRDAIWDSQILTRFSRPKTSL